MHRYSFTIFDSMRLSHHPGETAMKDVHSTHAKQGSDPSQQHAESVPAATGDPPKEERNPRSRTRSPPNWRSPTFSNGLLILASRQIMAPFERVHILMQCQHEMTKSGRLSSPYSGMKHCFVTTIKSDGVTSLWRAGFHVHAVEFFSSQAFSLLDHKGWLRDITGYDKIAKYDLESSYRKSLYLQFLMNQVPASVFVYPLDYARTRLATNVKAPPAIQCSLDSNVNRLRNRVGCQQFSGVIDVWLKTLKSDGVRGIYRGFGLRSIEETLATVILTEIKTKLEERKQKQLQKNHDYLGKALEIITLPSIIVAWYPLNSVSRRMMMTSGEAEKYRGITDAFQQIVKREGFLSLYKGIIPFALHTGLTAATIVLFVSGVVVIKVI